MAGARNGFGGSTSTNHGQLTWMSHPHDDAYWRHGSVRLGESGQGYERIAIPTMIIAGWADGYRNASFRTIEYLSATTRLLAGPWSHASPASSAPGPRIDHVPQMAAFFAERLRDAPGPASPPHTWFCRFSHAPDPILDTVPGRGDLIRGHRPDLASSPSACLTSRRTRCERMSEQRPGSPVRATCLTASRMTSDSTMPHR
jgi:hypothetical protein